MGLSNKQIQWVKENRKKYSVRKLAKKLGVEQSEVQNILDKNPLPRTPKIFYLFLILIPLLFIVLLEVSLNLFNYGYNTQTWMEVSPGRLGLNPDFARRYFYNTKNVPESLQDTFLKVKPNNSFRVFVLGGSSAEGYPFMPLGSFSRYIRKRLEIMYPDSKIEVVNVALTAVNTYTIRDIVPDVLAQKPDLILMYAGHNEYYGALGVGSLESLGRSRDVVNLILGLNNFKIVQLLRNTIQSITKIFSSSKPITGTLMARMAKKKAIPFKSDIYNAGLQQFEGNMQDIIEMIKVQNVPLIISTLSSNLKGIAPFISKRTKNFPSAKIVFDSARKYIGINDTVADSLFRFAKDLDMLRFRAPEKINQIIKKLSLYYKIQLINVDSLFAVLSPDHIVGNNLITDHLHPTLRGYQYIGQLFYEEMQKLDYLPKTKPKTIPFAIQDSITRKNFNFSKLDSSVAAYKIKLLKNDWPFISKRRSIPTDQLLIRNNYIDSVAFNFVESKIPWGKAERLVASYYLARKNYSQFTKQMNLLIDQYPMITSYYNIAADGLLKSGKYNMGYKFLKRRYLIAPDYFSSKWLGIIELSRNNVKEAIKYLLESIKFRSNDPQVFYNLSGAYAKNKEYKKALKSIESCLSLAPNFKGAKILRKQLKTIVANMK